MPRYVVMCFVMASLCALGCGGTPTPKGRLPVYAVSGTVTYKGKPVTYADVTFSNLDSKKSSFGRTDESGAYRLTTYAGNDGATAGRHTVTIAKLEPPAAPPKPLAGVESQDYAPPGVDMSTDPVKPKPAIPEKYAKAETSGFTAEVSADGSNQFHFDLMD